MLRRFKPYAPSPHPELAKGKRVRIMVLGVRGIPNVQGGVETHAEQLYGRLARLGCDVEILVRSPFVKRDYRIHEGIRLRPIWSPRTSGFEAVIHSILGVIYAGFARPDVLHVHAVGPAIVTPIARVMGLRVIVTHHGPDYERDKWGWFARWVLRTGESLGMRYSHARIAISRVILDSIRTKYHRECDLIPNGSVAVQARAESNEIERFGLERGRYFLQVSRIVPEKRQLELIQAYTLARPQGWKLALVGAGGNEYSKRVERAAALAGSDVVLTGFQRGVALQQLYSHAGAFVLPSSHEGLPIAILEALSYGLPVLASNIPANLEIGLEDNAYFPVGDIPALAERLKYLAQAPSDPATNDARREWVARTFDWEQVSQQTYAVYQRVLGRSSQIGEQRAPQV